jgi:hypothetical protein
MYQLSYMIFPFSFSRTRLRTFLFLSQNARREIFSQNIVLKIQDERFLLKILFSKTRTRKKLKYFLTTIAAVIENPFI